MRILPKTLFKDELITAQDVSSDILDVSFCYAGSFQIMWGNGTQTGSVCLQASLDTLNWTEVPNTNCPVGTAAGSLLWNLSDIHYPYVRVNFKLFDPRTVTALAFMKGG